MTEDENAIRDLVSTWMSATEAGDIETVLSLMTDDVVFMVPGREPFGKEEFAALSKDASDLHFDARSEILELQILGDWAFIRCHIDLRITPPAQEPFRRAGKTLTLLRKDSDGQWRIARDANLLTVPS